MGEFATAGSEAGFKALDLAKQAAIEIRDSIGSNWSGNDELKYSFPDKAITGPAPSGELEMFQWTTDKTYTFESAYYSHIRATNSKQKKHAETERKKFAKRGIADGVFDKKMDAAVLANLKAKYVKKHGEKTLKLKAMAGMADGSGNLTQNGRTALAAMHRAYNDKYGTKIAPAATPQQFADALAAAIVKKDKFVNTYHKAWYAAVEELAIKVINDKSPGTSPEDAKKKLAKKTAENIQSSFHRSVVMCYGVKYRTIKIDPTDVAKRWTKLEEKLKTWENDEVKRIKQLTAIEYDNLIKRKDLGDTNALKLAEERLAQQAAEMKGVVDTVDKKTKEMDAEKQRIAGLMASVRRIGAVTVYPLESISGGLMTGIKFKNTNAGLGATVAHDGTTVTVRLSFDETGKTGIPFTNGIFDGKFKVDGTLVFNEKGECITRAGKIGEKFAELTPGPTQVT